MEDGPAPQELPHRDSDNAWSGSSSGGSRRPGSSSIRTLSARDPGRHERVITLARDPDDLVEPASEAHAGLTEQRDVETGAVRTLPLQRTSADARRAGAASSPGSGSAVGRGVRSTSSDGWAGWSGSGKWWSKTTPGGQPIQAGCLDPRVTVSTQEAQVQAVADDGDDVHEPHCSETGHRAQEPGITHRQGRDGERAVTAGS